MIVRGLCLSSSQLGSTSVQLAEKLVTFGSVPLNMPSARTAVLHNTGQNHAYYQVHTHTHPKTNRKHKATLHLFLSVCLSEAGSGCEPSAGDDGESM